MAFNVSIKPFTFFEIDEAVFWYERQLHGLGNRFLFELNNCIEKLREQPKSYLIIEAPVRRILLQSFPYKLLFFVKDENEIVIIALVHTKQSKRFIKKRINK